MDSISRTIANAPWFFFNAVDYIMRTDQVILKRIETPDTIDSGVVLFRTPIFSV